MSNQFEKPDFSRNDLELRLENDIICIYGTDRGLKKLSDLCLELIEHSQQGHIHLEECSVLTKKSLKGAIAIFGKK